MQNEKIDTKIEVPPETKKKIDLVLERIKAHINKSGLKLEPLNDGSGYCGTYSFSTVPDTSVHNRTNFYLTITDSHNNKHSFTEHFSASQLEIPVTEKAVNMFIEDKYKLFYYSVLKNKLSELDGKELGFFIRRELKAIEDKYPEEFSFVNQPQKKTNYVCSIEKIFRAKESTAFKIQLRPASEIETGRIQYLKIPPKINFTSGTNDIKEIEELGDKIEHILITNGIVKYNLKHSGLLNNDKKIPKEWVNLEKVTLLEEGHKNGSKTYKVQLVSQDDKKRQTRILKVLGNISKEEASKITNYLKKDLLPSYLSGEHKDDPLTLTKITRSIIEHFPYTARISIANMERRSDIRHIIINEDEKLRLGTPTVSKRDECCKIYIYPPKEDNIRGMYRRISVPLNTADSDTLHSRTNAVQALSEVVLKEYFNNNPIIEIVTGETNYKEEGKIQKRIIMRRPEPNEIAPEGMVFLDTLIEEHLKPAYKQFNRYIYWQTDAKKEEGGTYKITAQIMRNKNAEPFPENDKILGKTWEFSAKDEKSATEFCRDLERNILRKEHFFSVNRPVEKFGLTSMQLVARESLKETIKSHKQVTLNNKIDELLLQNGRAIN